VRSAKALEDGYEELEKQNPDWHMTRFNFISVAQYGEEYGSDLTGRTSNKLFGIPMMGEQELQNLVAKYVH